MSTAQIGKRLGDVGVSSTFGTTLQTLAQQDDIAGRHNWGFVIPTVAAALGAQDATIAPFATAWGLLNAALRRIDHVQDGDADDHALPISRSTGAHYNMLLSS